MIRIAALDNARAVLLLLGVLFHATVFVFLFREPSSTAEFLLVVFVQQFLHVFRMPAFFVIAGFFAAYLLESRGGRSFLSNRASRILLPLLIFWIPLTFANNWASQGSWKTGKTSFAVLPIDFQHLWFLYFLVLFSVTLWAIWPILRRIPATGVKPIWFMVATAAAMPLVPGLFDGEGTLATDSTALPDLGLVGFYFLIFVSGVVMFFGREPWFAFLEEQSLWLLTVFVASFTIFFLIQDLEFEPVGWLYSTAVVSGAYGAIGLFLRFGTKQSSAMKFLSESSYWVYLVHLPLVLFFLVTFGDLGFAAPLTIFLTLGSTLLVSLLSYKVLVRHTPISLLLNGKRYPLRNTHFISS